MDSHFSGDNGRASARGGVIFPLPCLLSNHSKNNCECLMDQRQITTFQNTLPVLNSRNIDSPQLLQIDMTRLVQTVAAGWLQVNGKGPVFMIGQERRDDNRVRSGIEHIA